MGGIKPLTKFSEFRGKKYLSAFSVFAAVGREVMLLAVGYIDALITEVSVG